MTLAEAEQCRSGIQGSRADASISASYWARVKRAVALLGRGEVRVQALDLDARERAHALRERHERLQLAVRGG